MIKENKKHSTTRNRTKLPQFDTGHLQKTQLTSYLMDKEEKSHMILDQ